MSTQFAPSASQVCHCMVCDVSAEPVHVPASRRPSTLLAVTPMVGGDDGTGTVALVIAPDASESAASEMPAKLRAVTATRRVDPVSPSTGTYSLSVAPSMSAQFAPSPSQRCHWYT